MLNVVTQNTGLKISKKVLKQPHPGVLIWYELFYLLTTRLDDLWYTILIDESDDIIPETPIGIRWKLQEWLKNSMRDLRKTKINLFLSTHALNDVDYRIRSKIQFFIYMKNAKIPKHSRLNKTLPLKLKIGDLIIESGNFGFGYVVPYEQPTIGQVKCIITPKEKIYFCQV